MNPLFAVERYGFGKKSTLGLFTIRDVEIPYFSIEDPRRKVKVMGETCIPALTYEIKLRTEGTKHEDYLKRFPNFHRGMLWLQAVPEFEYVYIHPLNKATESLGCIGPNMKPVALASGEFEGADSTTAYVIAYKRAIEAFDAGEQVYIEITDRTRRVDE